MTVHLSVLNPSASGLDRAVACPASVVLPQVGHETELAERGTICHSYLEDCAYAKQQLDDGIATETEMLDMFAKSLANVPEEYREWCGGINLRSLLAGFDIWWIETAFAVDVTTGQCRILDKAAARDYSAAKPTEFFGTLDIGGYINGVLTMRDYKTGQKLGAPKERMQMRFFGLVGHLLTGATEINVEFVYIAEDSSVEFVSELFRSDDCGSVLEQLRTLHAALAGARAAVRLGNIPRISTGDHCRYCPAFTACPAKRDLLAMVAEPLRDVAANGDLMSPEQLGAAWPMFQSLKELVDKCGYVFKDAVHTTGGLPLANGKVLAVVPTSGKRSADSSKVINLARKLGASKAQLDECYRKPVFPVIREVNSK